MTTNPRDLLRVAHSTTSRAWYTNPVRRLFFNIMAPFLVHQADMTRAVEEQSVPRFERLERQGEYDRAITATLSEQIDKVRQQLLFLDGLRKEQMAVGKRIGGLEDTTGQLEDQMAGLSDRMVQMAQRMEDTSGRLHDRVADLSDRIAQVAQRMTDADERQRLVQELQDARDTPPAFPGIFTLPHETRLAIAGTSLFLYEGPYGRFLLRQPDLISDHVARGGFWDEYLKPIIERTGRPDRSAIDAGAYLGFHSTYMSRYFGTVYSFEPQLEMYQMTCANLLLNNCRNVVVENAALFDVSGRMRIARRELQEIPVPGELSQPGYDVIGNAAALVFELASEPDEHTVPCTTIDALDLTTLGLLKVDTQGSDLHVLKGARQTIARCRPTIVAEFERELAKAHHDTYDDYRAFFKEMDYEVSVLEDRGSGKQIDLLGVPR